MGADKSTGIKSTRRCTKRRAVSSGSHILSRMNDIIRELMFISTSEGENMVGEIVFLCGGHGIRVGEENRPGSKDSGLGVM